MNKRKNIIIFLSILLVSQIFLYIILNFFSSQNIKSRTIGKKFLDRVKKENIISLVISDDKDSFLIEKRNDEWFVKMKEKFVLGDSEKIYSYINLLLELTQGVVRDKSVNSETDKTYGFDKDSYQKVDIKTNKNKSFTIYIGKTGQQRGTSYVRYDNEKKVREVKSAIATQTGNQPIKWAKTKIFDTAILQDIENCELEGDFEWFRGNYKITKIEAKEDKKEEYIIEPPISNKKLIPYVLENIVTSVVHFEIDDYIFDRDISDKEKIATVKLNLLNNKSFEIYIYPADENDAGDYIIDVDFNDYLYLADETDIKRIFKPEEDLIETGQE
jgi:hypothetical protein